MISSEYKICNTILLYVKVGQAEKCMLSNTSIIASDNTEFLKQNNADHLLNTLALYQDLEDSSC